MGFNSEFKGLKQTPGIGPVTPYHIENYSKHLELAHTKPFDVTIAIFHAICRFNV